MGDVDDLGVGHCGYTAAIDGSVVKDKNEEKNEDENVEEDEIKYESGERNREGLLWTLLQTGFIIHPQKHPLRPSMQSSGLWGAAGPTEHYRRRKYDIGTRVNQ